MNNIGLIIDIVLVGIVILFAIFGLIKGFIQTLIKFFKGATGVFVSALLTKPFASLLVQLKLDQAIAKLLGSLKLVNGVMKEEAFNEILNGAESVAGNVVGENITSKLAIMIKTFFPNLFTDAVTYASYSEFTQKFNAACGATLLIIIAFLFIVLMLNIILTILNKLFTNSSLPFRFGVVDRLLGLVMGVLSAAIMITIIVVALNISRMIPVVDTSVENILAETKIAGMLYNNINIILKNVVTQINFSGLIR